MSNRFFIITGTSRGIGQAIAKSLLESEDIVCGISRNDSAVLSQYPNYQHTYFDLQQIEELEGVIQRTLHQVDHESVGMVCLINNAAMLEPLSPIEQCPIEDISTNIHINLVAPIILTAVFIKSTNNWKMRRKVINISSGSGIYANPSMSIYSTAKAGLNMFTRCVGVEQSSNTNPVEIIAVDPGMVETKMQQTARSKKEKDFIMARYFKEAYLAGQLQSTEAIADRITKIINNKYDPGKLVNYREG